MKKVVFVFLIGLAHLFIWSSCGGGSCCKHAAQGTENEDRSAVWGPDSALYRQVMRVHDDAMAKMGEVARRRQALKAHEAVADRQKTASDAIFLLRKADDGMMDWMHAFHSDPSEVAAASDQERTAYLQAELQKISRVAHDIDHSIGLADSLLAVWK
jgi:hypothetical protein